MAAIDLSHRIHVSSSNSASGGVWTVFVADESHSSFEGDGAKGRAIESALQLAEVLRLSGTVLIVVETVDRKETVTSVARSKLAS
jgi:hypothetical protein